jgi:hypothetical protein
VSPSAVRARRSCGVWSGKFNCGFLAHGRHNSELARAQVLVARCHQRVLLRIRAPSEGLEPERTRDLLTQRRAVRFAVELLNSRITRIPIAVNRKGRAGARPLDRDFSESSNASKRVGRRRGRSGQRWTAARASTFRRENSIPL